MNHVLQCKTAKERKPFQRMVFVGHFDKKAIEKASKLVSDDNDGKFVETIAFKDGVAVIHVWSVDDLLATYVLTRMTTE